MDVSLLNHVLDTFRLGLECILTWNNIKHKKDWRMRNRKTFMFLVFIAIVIVLFVSVRPAAARIYCQQQVDGMRKWDNETSKWFSLSDLDPKMAADKYESCLHRFGE